MTELSSDDPFVTAFNNGALFLYPTEAVYGIGCDPDNETAVQALLARKQRPVEKGLILIAKTYSQLLPYVNDDAIPMDRRTQIFSSWPGPNTWLLPKSASAPDWITGGSDLIAVRVTAHPVVQSLCERVNKPLVSTSANVTGLEAARTLTQAQQQLGEDLLCIEGALGNAANPSSIRHGLTGQLIRAS
ncbi:Sua5/YciO/YrdC/YwlC family protein [Aestuariibacter halophilus]|uniref:Threonylcarbamoyl-AMP synthase n=1 Tax=Fluctibacter halophilus TaxID=226011 RepID=A0ABS8GCF8_9ALTE|nr:Sua5/YciO/YrdC/YwlC family protein [Aestuariibacter halophilus]MCC2616891.1 Sua5/YciO/YrdC/YwlC family protein [Aestuariibacter halophilus]